MKKLLLTLCFTIACYDTTIQDPGPDVAGAPAIQAATSSQCFSQTAADFPPRYNDVGENAVLQMRLADLPAGSQRYTKLPDNTQPTGCVSYQSADHNTEYRSCQFRIVDTHTREFRIEVRFRNFRTGQWDRYLPMLDARGEARVQPGRYVYRLLSDPEGTWTYASGELWMVDQPSRRLAFVYCHR